MSKTIRLTAPSGLSAANWNGQRYDVVDGVIEVPAEAHDELTRPIHGFTRYVEGARGSDSVATIPAGQSIAPPLEFQKPRKRA